jgi:hypothetical protein
MPFDRMMMVQDSIDVIGKIGCDQNGRARQNHDNSQPDGQHTRHRRKCIRPDLSFVKRANLQCKSEEHYEIVRDTPSDGVRASICTSLFPDMCRPLQRGCARLSFPSSPGERLFARMSTNYSADLKTRVEPCIFGGSPDCSRCGCAISSGLHWLRTVKAGSFRIETLGSVGIGSIVGRVQKGYTRHPRWNVHPMPKEDLVQITAVAMRSRKLAVAAAAVIFFGLQA